MPTPNFSPQLEELKQRLLKSDDFAGTVRYFHDHLADNDLFLSREVGQRVQSEKLSALLEAATGRFLRNPGPQLTQMMIVQVQGTLFYHGTFLAQPYLGSFLYFDDAGQGILTFVKPADPQMHFVRVTPQTVGGDPERN
ncbi:MAG: hypothetical protein KIT22_18680 [Verrucomicrobiae bacterium]|nr:hypothetical protein [Verrucomicrobiae bacterium]